MLVVGGGYIAVEFAGIFHGLGAHTSLLYRGDLFLRGFDGSVRKHLQEELTKRGLDLQFNADIERIDKQADGSLKATLKDGRVLEADCVFYATGRRPMLDNLGLENTGVKLDERGFVAVDDLYQTAEPSILAIGDVIGRVQLTPVALAEGMAVARRLFKPEQYRAVDYANIATAVFSLPNIGTVGLTEEDARKNGHNVQVFESRFRPMKLTLTDCQEKTLMKLVVDADTDKVLGCHMVGPDAGEIVQGWRSRQGGRDQTAFRRNHRRASYGGGRIRHHAHACGGLIRLALLPLAPLQRRPPGAGLRCLPGP